MELAIESYSLINESGAWSNGDHFISSNSDQQFSIYMKSIYKKLGMEYPKFYKMDPLCQLALLTTEILLIKHSLQSERNGEDIAIILNNRSASYASDTKHHEAITDDKNYFPSPAVFVYTLPNVMIGELSIRHKITGEGSCFMETSVNSAFLCSYVENLFHNEQYKYCITGWIDHNLSNFSAGLCLITHKDVTKTTQLPFDKNFNSLLGL